MLILTIAEDLNELLQNCCLTAIAPLRKLCRVMVVAVHLSIVLVVTVLRSKYCWADRACKVVDMVFPIQSRDV